MIYKRNICELFKIIPKCIPPKTTGDYRTKYQTTINSVGVKGT